MFYSRFCVLQIVKQCLATLLEKLGHSVVWAKNGQEAVEKWRDTMQLNVLLETMTSGQSINSNNKPVPASRFDICFMNMSVSVCRLAQSRFVGHFLSVVFY